MVEYSANFINIISAFLVLVLGLVIASITTNILRKVLREAELNKILQKQLKFKFPLENSLVSIVKYMIYGATFIFVLNQLGIPTFVLRIIFLVLIVIIIVFIVLAFKDWIPNIVSGFYIYKTQKIKIGDTILINNVKGKVKRINLIETVVFTPNKEVIHIPNSNITKYEVCKK
ncbi:MAG TPA: mechanosensitive ion channel domain-containing protein [Candidatus Nanoarchaeia archaeon]|nr:mechanosensitive ion channel domain-containing protein [Candidatus Nanoarchaeia archaeon]